MNIILIGQHGAGKTAVGRKLADALWWRFVDVDDRLAAAAKAEPSGVELQDSVLELLAKEDSLVIAVSAASVPAGELVARLRHNGRVVYLHAPDEVLAERVAAAAAAKPAGGPAQPAPASPPDAPSALAQRDAQYRALADLTLETGPMPVDAVVRLIVRLAM